MTDYRGGEWTEETQAEFERVYEVYNDGNRDTIFALLFEEKKTLECRAELDKRAIQSAMDKIDAMQGEIEAVLRIADSYSHDHAETDAGGHFAVIASRLDDLLP